MKDKEKTNRKHRGRSHWLAGLLITALIAVSAVAFVLSAKKPAAASEPRIPAGVSLASWRDNGHGGQYVLQLLEGKAPEAGKEVAGVVLSDTNCQPDTQGFSHCNNGIRLANGARITVINTHQMWRYQCLHPGEAVSVTRVNASWIVAKLH